MKKVLVMGISGTFGRHVAKALLEHGYDVSAMMRNPERLPPELNGVAVIQGDVQDKQSVAASCLGMDIVIYGVNPPNYDWHHTAIAYLGHVIEVAEQQQLTIVFPANVYVFDPADGPCFDEFSILRPRSQLGQIRHTMESHLKRASSRGATVIMLRMGDFIAPDAHSSWFYRLLKQHNKGWTLTSPGPVNLKHGWCYVPDAAEVIAQLLNRQDALPNFSLFHMPGLQLSMQEIATALTRVSGKAVKIQTFPWRLIRLASPFSTACRGILQMRYLWQEELVLSGDKLRGLLGHNLPETEIHTILSESLGFQIIALH